MNNFVKLSVGRKKYAFAASKVCDLSNDELGEIMKAKHAVQSFFKEVTDEVKRRICDGETIENVHLAIRHGTPWECINKRAVIDILDDAGLDSYYFVNLISLTEMRNYLNDMPNYRHILGQIERCYKKGDPRVTAFHDLYFEKTRPHGWKKMTEKELSNYVKSITTKND